MEFKSSTNASQYLKIIALLSVVIMVGSLDVIQPKVNCYSSIYQFGDSLADTGNLLISGPGVLSAIAELPYGETYFNKATGRCSNGRLVIDFIAQAYGLLFLPPYLRRLADYSSGVNFAVAGATALNALFFLEKGIPIITSFSLSTQIQWFKDFKKMYCSGTEENAKKILVPGNLPIGCSPFYLATHPSNFPSDYDDMGCLVKFNNFSQSNNKLLRMMLQDVQRDHPDVSIVYADYYSAEMKILRNPQKYGLQKNNFRVCCGRGGKYNYSPPFSCNVAANLCPNPKEYINWDGIHLTETVYRAISQMLINGEVIIPPLPLVNKNC
ncbi:hypothetical protein SUGI_0908920 [Cryptomeria japonica]|nr:hypothetical protein SUGI_0908920 [Cryptomeria japonica]